MLFDAFPGTTIDRLLGLILSSIFKPFNSLLLLYVTTYAGVSSTGATSQSELESSRGSLSLPVLLDLLLSSSPDPSDMAMVRFFFLTGGLSLARLREVDVMLTA